MGYSSPKCICNAPMKTHIQVHARSYLNVYMINSHPESSPTPSHLPKPRMRKHLFFLKQFLLFLKLYYRSIGKNMGLPSEANVLENLMKQSWSSFEMIYLTVSQPHSPEIHPVKFLSKKVFAFLSIFHVMHSPNF